MNTDEHSWMLMGYTSNKTVGLSDESWDLTMNTVGVQPINTAVFFCDTGLHTPTVDKAWNTGRVSCLISCIIGNMFTLSRILATAKSDIRTNTWAWITFIQLLEENKKTKHLFIMLFLSCWLFWRICQELQGTQRIPLLCTEIYRFSYDEKWYDGRIWGL